MYVVRSVPPQPQRIKVRRKKKLLEIGVQSYRSEAFSFILVLFKKNLRKCLDNVMQTRAVGEVLLKLDSNVCISLCEHKATGFISVIK